MRIIAGAWRGRPLIAPAGRATRPTSDRARETLFSMLQSRLGGFAGLAVIDLFAGTGALGLEALSRGAAHCTFVESDRAALPALRANVAKLGAEARSDVRAQSVEHVGSPLVPCDLILLDPPYDSALAQLALDKAAGPAWLAPGGWISVEHERATLTIPSRLAVQAERKAGRASLLLLRAEA
jgi:16S rRNA (guanine966-N2)-methyltransferase